MPNYSLLVYYQSLKLVLFRILLYIFRKCQLMCHICICHRSEPLTNCGLNMNTAVRMTMVLWPKTVIKVTQHSLWVHKTFRETSLYVSTRPPRLKVCLIILLSRHESHPSTLTPTETERLKWEGKKRIKVKPVGDDQFRYTNKLVRQYFLKY